MYRIWIIKLLSPKYCNWMVFYTIVGSIKKSVTFQQTVTSNLPSPPAAAVWHACKSLFVNLVDSCGQLVGKLLS